MKLLSRFAALAVAAALCSCDDGPGESHPDKTPSDSPEKQEIAAAVRELRGTVRELREEVGRLGKQLAKKTAKPQWEYQVLRFNAPPASARSPRLVELRIFNQELVKRGTEGWELVFMQAENETVYPNFGNPEMTTGLQPNLRTASVLCVFRKEKK